MYRTLILEDFTIDYATLDKDGNLRGHSNFISVYIRSNYLDNKENVIIDFSNAKKIIKKFLEFCNSNSKYKNLEGYDHKLIIPNNLQFIYAIGSEFIKNNHFSISPVQSGVKLVPNYLFDYTTKNGNSLFRLDYFAKLMEEEFKIFLNNEILLNKDLTVDEFNQYRILWQSIINFHVSSNSKKIISLDLLHEKHPCICTHTFDYVHGLPNSSSYACQNIFHGHQSKIEVFWNNFNEIPFEVEYRIKEVFKNNFWNKTHVFYPEVYVKTRSRGDIIFVKNDMSSQYNEYIDLGNDATAENLIVFYKNKILEEANKMLNRKIDENDIIVYCSEGLKKGVML